MCNLCCQMREIRQAFRASTSDWCEFLAWCVSVQGHLNQNYLPQYLSDTMIAWTDWELGKNQHSNKCNTAWYEPEPITDPTYCNISPLHPHTKETCHPFYFDVPSIFECLLHHKCSRPSPSCYTVGCLYSLDWNGRTEIGMDYGILKETSRNVSPLTNLVGLYSCSLLGVKGHMDIW